MSILNNINISWNTYEIDATILVMLVLAFKLYTNHKASELDYQKTFISIPGEITFLVLGFWLSDMVTKVSDVVKQRKTLRGIFIALFVLYIQIAWEIDIKDRISNLDGKSKLKIIIMYIVSAFLYIKALQGGFGI